MKEKKCISCSKEKKLDDYFNDKTRKDGKDYYCKSCRRDIHNEYYSKNRDKILENMRRYVKERRDNKTIKKTG